MAGNYGNTAKQAVVDIGWGLREIPVSDSTQCFPYYRMTLGNLLNLEQLLFTHLQNRCDNIYFLEWLCSSEN